MKKITPALVVVFLFSFISCSVISVAAPSKGKVIGTPFNKKWVVKMGKNEAGGNIIIFSEDGGKAFYPIFDFDGIGDATMIWSPDGKYLMVAWQWLSRYAPILEKGFWRYTPDIYDPAEHLYFSGPTNLFPGCQLMGANWVKGSQSDLNVEFISEGNERKTKKISIDEWEKNSTRVEIKPYLHWLGGEVVARLKKNQIESIRSLVKGVNESEIDSAMSALSKYFDPRKYRSFKIYDYKDSSDDERLIWVMSTAGKCNLVISIMARIGSDQYPQITKFSVTQGCSDDEECTQ